jgi:signal transduction histidine kinase
MRKHTEILNLSKTELFQKISEICTLANSIDQGDTLLNHSLKLVMKLFEVHRGSIFIVDHSRNELTLKASCGLKSTEKNQYVKKMGQGFVGKVASEKKPIIVDDIDHDARFEKFQARQNYNSNSFICVPMMVKNELTGVINITDKISGHRFQNEELQLLDFLGSQIALNYQRINLYQQFTNILNESQSLRNQLGESHQEKEHLKKQIDIHDRFATIGKLAGGIAHEFNNPLDGVMRYTNLCLLQVSEDDVIHGYLSEIQQGLARMAGIVKNLLACVKSESVTTTKIDISSLIQRCLTGLDGTIQSRRAKITVNLIEPLPKIVDLGIERVFSNLLRNSLDAIKEEGEITISVKLKSDGLSIIIRDSGHGINPDMIDQIFEPFFTTKDIDKGSGLGLTIVGEVVKAYNGTISVESQVDSGTEFTIHLPTTRIL